MVVEWVWYGASIIVILLLLWRYVNWHDMRRVWVSFFIMQMITWGVGSVLVKYHLVEYPVRLFPEATRQNFIIGYFLYPCVSVLYIQCFPENNRIKQLVYTGIYAAVAACWDYVMATYTGISNHLNWNPANQFVLGFISLLFCRLFVLWMFKADFPGRGTGDG